MSEGIDRRAIESTGCWCPADVWSSWSATCVCRGAAEHREWLRQIRTIPGASTRQHPAPYPQDLASRLIRMFSFVGDTVLDPFLGTGTTSVAAVRAGRNSVGVEVDREYVDLARSRFLDEEVGLFGRGRSRVESTR